MIVGGVASGFGIEDPQRRVEAVPTRGSSAAGECGHGATRRAERARCRHECPTRPA